ncbi:hypothetical protein XIS1_1210054 [Xenorhabdus innexi]|uniref:Uncharacterized protein n=1 Tax=Xenorhabdus innexi TaxID=290109 RepID=A0A1N6MS95_9GAMM|nr:hypothetical protein XIS1_1210054 [Xenorhabdus innexi]
MRDLLWLFNDKYLAGERLLVNKSERLPL